MKISELATQTDTTAKTLRFYEQVGLLPEPARTDGGYRDYDVSATMRIGFIRSGQALGLTLAQIRDLLNIRDDGRAPCSAAAELLDNHIDELTIRIRDMQSLRRDLRDLRDRGQGLNDDDCLPDSVCHIINPEACTCGQHSAAGD